jgi:hypothetical protein
MHIKVNSWMRIRIEVKSWIRIRIKVLRIRNTGFRIESSFLWRVSTSTVRTYCTAEVHTISGRSIQLFKDLEILFEL